MTRDEATGQAIEGILDGGNVNELMLGVVAAHAPDAVPGSTVMDISMATSIPTGTLHEALTWAYQEHYGDGPRPEPDRGVYE